MPHIFGDTSGLSMIAACLPSDDFLLSAKEPQGLGLGGEKPQSPGQEHWPAAFCAFPSGHGHAAW